MLSTGLGAEQLRIHLLTDWGAGRCKIRCVRQQGEGLGKKLWTQLPGQGIQIPEWGCSCSDHWPDESRKIDIISLLWTWCLERPHTHHLGFSWSSYALAPISLNNSKAGEKTLRHFCQRFLKKAHLSLTFFKADGHVNTEDDDQVLTTT